MDFCTRQLIHVPILHSPTDMGSVAGQLEAAYIELFGPRRWHEHLAQIEHFWQCVADAVDGLGLDFARVDLYQDGLPVCDWELDIAREAARRSENYKLLMGYVGRGARLIGTEDPHLLVEEYRGLGARRLAAGRDAEGGMSNVECRVSKGDEGVSGQWPVASSGQSDERQDGPPPARDSRLLLDRRDAYIANRIGQTLKGGRTGLLFLGLLHDVRRFLPADVVVQSVDVLRNNEGPKAPSSF